MLNRKFLSGCFTFLASLTASNVFADITMQQRIEVDAGGAMSFLATGGTTTTYISNDRSRSESKMEAKSGLMGSFMPNADSTSIMRLDKELIWQLMPDKQKYSEMTFEQMRAQMQQSMAQLEEMQQGGGAGTLPVSEEDCEWSDPKIEITETGEKQRFANVKAEQHLITIQETCTVPESGQSCVLTWKMENWMARRMPGEEETMAFNKALAERLGIEEMMSGAQASSMGLMAMFKGGWEEALDEMSDLQGFPVKTVMQMEMGGENCTAASGQQIAMDDIWSGAVDAGINAGTQTAGYHAGQKISEEASKAMGDGVGGSIAGSAVGAASDEVISGFLSRFRKKKKAPEPEPQPAPAEPTAATAVPADGSAVLFRITTELTAIDDNKIPADKFEVPAGWKNVSRN